MVSPIFHRIIRFSDSAGTVYYGEVTEQYPWDSDLHGITVPIYEGSLPWNEDFRMNDSKTAKVSRILSPVPSGSFIHGIGLNYRKHAEEGGV
jgi:hypothetical protein